MKTILVIYEQESTTQLLFCDFLNKYASVTGDRIIIKKSIKIKAVHINECDFLITIRSMSPFDLYIVKLANSIGKVCISFWDDDLTENTENLFILEKRRAAMIAELKIVDAILTSNLYLAQKLSTFGNKPRVFVLDTAVDQTDLPSVEDRENSIMRIVYAASPAHNKDFNKNIIDALKRLFKKYPNSFDLSFVGVRPKINEVFQFPVYYHPTMSMTKYREHMIFQNYDIGIAPLIECEFSKSKYYNKYIDYTLNNVVGLYSNCLPYTLVINNGHNGFLVDDKMDSWFEAFETVLVNRKLRRTCLNNAKNEIRSRFSFENVSNTFSSYLDSFTLVSTNEKLKCYQLVLPKIEYLLFKVIYLPLAYIQTIGVRETIERLHNYLISIKLIKNEMRKEDR